MDINTTQVTNYADKFINTLIDYSPRLISALLILFVGLYVIRLITQIVKKVMIKRNLDPTLTQFLVNIMLWGMRFLLFIPFISKIGIETSSFVAILGSMGLAVGLSLQGSLSNFAGGMLIILFKPFKSGDTIEAQGVFGTVSEIQIFVTKVLTVNNQMVFLPNGALSNGIITNYSLEEKRRADLTFSISYDSDIKKAKEVLLNVLIKNPKVLENPVPEVFVKNLTSSAVEFAVRPWATNENYASVFSDTLEDCKEALDLAGIEVQPFVMEKSKSD